MTMTRRTYVRPMDGWWKRDPFFLVYMAREVTSIFVVAYAGILLVTVLRLAEGEASFDRWVDVLRSAPMVLVHVLLLIVFVYHTFSWFQTMPKTMAPLVVAGRKVPACAISAAGFAASLVASVVLFIVVKAIAS
jgi:fumarate reductase subunit C